MRRKGEKQEEMRGTSRADSDSKTENLKYNMTSGVILAHSESCCDSLEPR